MRSVRSLATRAPTAISATPDTFVHKRGSPGTQDGTSSSKNSGETKCIVPAPTSRAASPYRDARCDQRSERLSAGTDAHHRSRAEGRGTVHGGASGWHESGSAHG